MKIFFVLDLLVGLPPRAQALSGRQKIKYEKFIGFGRWERLLFVLDLLDVQRVFLRKGH